MMVKRISFLLAVVILAGDVAVLTGQENPAAPGFNEAGSDAEAVQIADEVMAAMGGRSAWDSTRFLTWNFFGRRRHFWDKQSGDLRVEGVGREDGKPYLILMNLHTGQGRAWRDGSELTGEGLDELLDLGEAAWINDAYWIFIPYKVKDSGVTLRSMGHGEMQDGGGARILQLTFEEVGRTPENKYLVYVADDSGLVEQWDFYAQASDAEPRFQIPWRNWQAYGSILLSDDRGESGHTDVAVFDELPPSVFTSPEPVDLGALGLGGD
jgi:hypothetical protein